MDLSARERLVRELTDELLVRIGREAPANAERAPDRATDSPHTPADPHGAHPAARDLAGYIDHTLLRPDATETEIRQLCREAAQYRFATVCVHPSWVRLCAGLLAGGGVAVCTVAGFPLGAAAADVKAYEARRAIFDGAREIDMVLNVGFLRSGLDDRVLEEIACVARVVHEGDARLKVILETALLTGEEKIRACVLARTAGADYVKTSTGFGPGGATVEDVALMRRAVGSSVGVKAAGGIRDAAAVRRMIAAGATRVGSSASVKIVTEDERVPTAPRAPAR